MSRRNYDPRDPGMRPFQAVRPALSDGGDTPRAYLERCLEAIDARESEVRAFTAFNLEGARQAADAATERYKNGQPLSPLDGMPIGIKDVYDTYDMPTQNGSPIFKDYQPRFDAASVHALRECGAVIVGKTVTTEFAKDTPNVTRNPWDTARTPGGSSSGSGAAVGGGMLPAGTGSQVRGSVQRPAAYCGAYAFKPTHGVINNAGSFAAFASINHLGIIASTLADGWTTAHTLSRWAGGDPGHASMEGPAALPDAQKPARLIRLETLGWQRTGDSTRETFDRFCAALRETGVEIVGRGDDPEVEAFEQALEEIPQVSGKLLGWEARYPMAIFVRHCPELISEAVRERAIAATRLTPEDYAWALDRAEALRRQAAAFADRADGFVSLITTGPAPVGDATGDPVYGDVCSVLRMPAWSLPLAAEDGMPLGIQLMGFMRQDATLAAQARWLTDAVLGGS